MRGKRKLFKFGIFLLVISLSCIGSGLFIGYLSTPERIISNAMKNLSSSIYKSKEKKETSQITEELPMITINTNIKTSINSQYITEKAKTDIESLKYHNLLKNITNLETNIKFSQNTQNAKLLLQIDKYLYNQPYLTKKYLVEDATEYRYIPDLNNNYINYGNNNYFENQTAIQDNNLRNIYIDILDAFKDSIKEEYLKTSVEETLIDGKKQYTNKISLSINDKNKKEIEAKITNKLETNILLKGIFIDEQDLTALVNKFIQENNLIFNIYTDKIGYNNLKYEIIINNKNNNFNIVYEPKKNKGYINKDNKLIYNFSITKNDTRTKIYIMLPNNTKVGSLIIEDNEIIFNFDNNKNNIYGLYKKEQTNINNESYSVLEKLNFRITNKTTELINLNVQLDSIISNTSKIEEDVSTSVFKSSISNEQIELYNNNITVKRNILYQ